MAVAEFLVFRICTPGTIARIARIGFVIYNAAGVAVSGYNIATGQAGIGDYLNFLPAIGGILGKLRQACFTEGTQVVVGYDEQGAAITRNIEDLREGDWVLAKDENNPDGEPVLKQVTKVSIKTVTQLRVLTLTNEDGDEQVIQTTDEHPFFVEGRGWIGAGELAAGDQITTVDGAVATVISSISTRHGQSITVYNLEVEGAHTFFVWAGPPADKTHLRLPWCVGRSSLTAPHPTRYNTSHMAIRLPILADLLAGLALLPGKVVVS